jgi:hypothetical protein
VKRLLPHYSGCEAKEIVKKVHFRIFQFDICNFVRSGIINYEFSTVIFDYGTKREGPTLFVCI